MHMRYHRPSINLRFAERSVRVLMGALAMFAVILGWRFADADPVSAIWGLYVVPIALLAVNFGTRGGLAGAGLALGLTVLWAETAQVHLGPAGYIARGVTFAAVAMVVGRQLRDRDRVAQEADRWFSISDEMCAVANFDGYFTRVNAAWTDCLGYTAEELLEKPYIEFVHPDDLERTQKEAAGLVDPEHSTVHFENRYRAKDGSWHWLLWSSRSDGELIYAAARDITDRKRLETTLQKFATEDKLTGIANLRAWEDRITVEGRRAARSNEPLSIVMLDLDNLKSVNDDHGHAAGDRLLRASAAGWNHAIRETDFLARLGGDEFGVLLPNCTEAAAEEVLERMRGSMPTGHRFSAGIAQWTDGEPLTTLLNRADAALYENKAQTRRGARR